MALFTVEGIKFKKRQKDIRALIIHGYIVNILCYEKKYANVWTSTLQI